MINTLVKHNLSRISTCHSPNGKIYNHINYILNKSGINVAKTRVYNKIDIGSDHDLVMMYLKKN